MSKPHRWVKEIHAWADGAVIEAAYPHIGRDKWWIEEDPTWNDNMKVFRIKPKEKQKVKMWQWVYRDYDSENILLTRRFFESEAEALTGVWKVDTLIQRADWTEIEVEVEDD